MNRTGRRRSAVSLEQMDVHPPAGDGPQYLATNRELAAQLDTAMAELPDEQREILVLHLESKLPFREIAQLKKISINTAQSRYRYGLDKLRLSLDEKRTP